jgi:hypothetical protein
MRKRERVGSGCVGHRYTYKAVTNPTMSSTAILTKLLLIMRIRGPRFDGSVIRAELEV